LKSVNVTALQAGVTWHSAGMQHIAPEQGWLDETLAGRLAKMPYTKRREEARLGRWTAKAAIARAVGIEPEPEALREIVVHNAADGAPQATVYGKPLDAVIAMTDRADWAVCAVLRGTDRIGCDLELVEPRSAAFVRDYFTRPEQDCVAASKDPDASANLIWSAKESALKVLRTGLRRDTRSVEVALLDGEQGGWSELAVTDRDGRRFPGWWIRYNSFLLTVVAEVPIQPPVSQQKPAPLQFAEPGHSWMENPVSLPNLQSR
jgi:4'-phosphopantetheinyl transferase